jgi:hypothetical protein
MKSFGRVSALRRDGILRFAKNDTSEKSFQQPVKPGLPRPFKENLCDQI